MTSNPRPASATTFPNALWTSETGMRFHSTAKRCPLRSSALGAPKVRAAAELAVGAFSSLGALEGGGRTVPAQRRSSHVRPFAVGRRRIRPCPRAGIERHEDELRDVLPRPPVGALALLYLPISPRRPEDASGFRPSEPPLARGSLWWQHNLNHLRAQALLTWWLMAPRRSSSSRRAIESVDRCAA
jgi:hypothetical protein